MQAAVNHRLIPHSSMSGRAAPKRAGKGGDVSAIKYFPYSGSSPRYTVRMTDCTPISPNLWDVSGCLDEKAEVINIHLAHGNAAIHTHFSVIPEPETLPFY